VWTCVVPMLAWPSFLHRAQGTVLERVVAAGRRGVFDDPAG